jgi:hypothetical protein
VEQCSVSFKPWYVEIYLISSASSHRQAYRRHPPYCHWRSLVQACCAVRPCSLP